MLSVLLFMLIAVPWLWCRLKGYQHNHYAYAGLQTQFRATARSFYALHMKTSGVVLGCFLVLGVIVGATYAAAGAAVTAMTFGLLPFFVLLAYAVGGAYFTASMQNLVWSQTGNREFRFRSALTFRNMLKLKLKNWFFIALWLGFYWPFAAVATARLKLEAMAVLTRVDPQHLIGQAMVQEGDAAGDAAGDLFGLDIGL